VDYQRLLLDHLDLIDQIVRTTGRRRHLSAAEQEDFASFVRLRLIEDDYAVLRKFQNRSSLRTYLSAVIERMSLDFCVERWGRWRPSAVAERLGPVAVLLDRLVSRDGHALEEAFEIVRTNHAASESLADLRKIWEQLPSRVKNTEVGEEAAATVRSNQTAESNVEDAERQKNIDRLERTLRSALDQVAAQDRVLLGLRFDQDLSVAEIAKLMGSSVPTLHRRLDKTVRQLRVSLSHAGFDPREVAGLIGHASISLSPLLRAEVERFLGPVRLTKQDG
jgi:RNA polymerase sigma factor for flagellar operon FliA